MTAHALLSASGAHRWMSCPASVKMEAPSPRTSSKFADEGTAAHELAAKCLLTKTDAAEHIGLSINVDGNIFCVNADMAGFVQEYLDVVRAIAEGGELLVEQRVDFSEAIGIPNSFGTSDVVILHADTLTIIDLKYGQGVAVSAEDNEQLKLYAVGALNEFGMVGDFQNFRVMIVQPRKKSISEEMFSLEELQTFTEVARYRAMIAREVYEGSHDNKLDNYLVPGEKQCRFCKAKATCPKLAAEVLEAVSAQTSAESGIDFDVITDDVIENIPPKDDDQLGAAMAKIDLIESWCTAVRAETERRLLAGTPVTGYKLVEGRKGARKWANEEEVEQMMKSMRIKKDDMYSFSLISPAQAEKVAKSGGIGPKQWPVLMDMVTQVNGKPSVAPLSDKRPALVVTPVENDFEAVDDLV